MFAGVAFEVLGGVWLVKRLSRRWWDREAERFDRETGGGAMVLRRGSAGGAPRLTTLKDPPRGRLGAAARQRLSRAAVGLRRHLRVEADAARIDVAATLDRALRVPGPDRADHGPDAGDARTSGAGGPGQPRRSSGRLGRRPARRACRPNRWRWCGSSIRAIPARAIRGEAQDPPGRSASCRPAIRVIACSCSPTARSCSTRSRAAPRPGSTSSRRGRFDARSRRFPRENWGDARRSWRRRGSSSSRRRRRGSRRWRGGSRRTEVRRGSSRRRTERAGPADAARLAIRPPALARVDPAAGGQAAAADA